MSILRGHMFSPTWEDTVFIFLSFFALLCSALATLILDFCFMEKGMAFLAYFRSQNTNHHQQPRRRGSRPLLHHPLFLIFYSPHLLRYTLSLAFLEIHLVPLKETKDYGKRCSSSSLLLVHTTFFQPSNLFCRLVFFTYCLFWTYGVD